MQLTESSGDGLPSEGKSHSTLALVDGDAMLGKESGSYDGRLSSNLVVQHVQVWSRRLIAWQAEDMVEAVETREGDVEKLLPPDRSKIVKGESLLTTSHGWTEAVQLGLRAQRGRKTVCFGVKRAFALVRSQHEDRDRYRCDGLVEDMAGLLFMLLWRIEAVKLRCRILVVEQCRRDFTLSLTDPYVTQCRYISEGVYGNIGVVNASLASLTAGKIGVNGSPLIPEVFRDDYIPVKIAEVSFSQLGLGAQRGLKILPHGTEQTISLMRHPRKDWDHEGFVTPARETDGSLKEEVALFVPSTETTVVAEETKLGGVVRTDGTNASLQEALVGKLLDRDGPMIAKLGAHHGKVSWDPDIFDNDESPPVLSQDDRDQHPGTRMWEMAKGSDGGYRRSGISLGYAGATPDCVWVFSSGKQTTGAKSSCHKDLIAAIVGVVYIIWTRLLMEGFGFMEGPSKLIGKCVGLQCTLLMDADLLTRGVTRAVFEAILPALIGGQKGCPA